MPNEDAARIYGRSSTTRALLLEKDGSLPRWKERNVMKRNRIVHVWTYFDQKSWFFLKESGHASQQLMRLNLSVSPSVLNGDSNHRLRPLYDPTPRIYVQRYVMYSSGRKNTHQVVLGYAWLGGLPVNFALVSAEDTKGLEVVTSGDVDWWQIRRDSEQVEEAIRSSHDLRMAQEMTKGRNWLAYQQIKLASSELARPPELEAGIVTTLELMEPLVTRRMRFFVATYVVLYPLSTWPQDCQAHRVQQYTIPIVPSNWRRWKGSDTSA